MRELSRLERLPAAAAEYGVIRTYLDWIADAPLGRRRRPTTSTSRTHARCSTRITTTSTKVKDRIIEHLAVSKLRNDPSGQILCLVGPPGVGKTSLGESIARTLGRPLLSPVGRRCARRSGSARPSAHIHRRDARLDHPRAARCRVDEPAAADRRDRQAWLRRPRRSRLGDARSARPRAERNLPRPLPRPALRPLEVLFICTANTARHDSGSPCSTAWR